MTLKRAFLLFVLVLLSSAAYADPATYTPAEWYQTPSLFIRSSTNPKSVVPIMASAGYGLPTDISQTILPVASQTIGTFSTAVTTIALVPGAREITICLTGQSKQAWLSLGGSTPYVGSAIMFSSSINITYLNPNEVIKVVASQTIGAVWIQR